MQNLKNLILKNILSDAVLPLARSILLRSGVTVFTFHRFSHPEGVPNGINKNDLAASLLTLRKMGYRFLSLNELIKKIGLGESVPPRSVVFTVDDGYFDFSEVAAPIFYEYDCPVTVFLTTGFIDEYLWLWWDKVEYAFLNSKINNFKIIIGEKNFNFKWDNHEQRRQASSYFLEILKAVPNSVKLEAITYLAYSLDIELPDQAPSKYRPMTWKQVRSCGQGDVDFGPHTITHPILSQCSDEEANVEISGSWARMKEETVKAVPILAYPNGMAGDFTEREVIFSKAAGLTAAVTTDAWCVTPSHQKYDPYRIPRFDFISNDIRLRQIVSGLEHKKRMIVNALSKG